MQVLDDGNLLAMRLGVVVGEWSPREGYTRVLVLLAVVEHGDCCAKAQQYTHPRLFCLSCFAYHS